MPDIQNMPSDGFVANPGQPSGQRVGQPGGQPAGQPRVVGPGSAKGKPGAKGKKKMKRMVLGPDNTCKTIRARRRGFVGTLRTSLNPFETDLYIFDDVYGTAMFCMENIAYLDNKPNRKRFPSGVYRVYNLNALGFDGEECLSLYLGGKRQTLRYIGHVPRKYVVHDKFMFRVRYDAKAKCWQYLDPTNNQFRALPFPPTQLCFHREDFKNYSGDLPSGKILADLDDKLLEKVPAVPQAQPNGRVGAPGRLGAPGRVGAPGHIGAPDLEPAYESYEEPSRAVNENEGNLYVLKVRYIKPDETVVGFGVVTPTGEKKKIGYSKVLQLAQEDKVDGVKVVNRGSGPFLQGVDFAISSLPTKLVN